MPGDVPYWGAGGVLDSVDSAIFNEPLVLLGEDGAPFFTPGKDVAYFVEGPTWVNNHIHALRPTASNGQFLTYALNAVDYANYITGATRDKLTQDDLKQIEVPCPPLDEQRRIADFLDAETARIDELSRLRTRQQELLTTRRWSHFQAALDDTQADATPLRRVIESIVDGPFGSSFSSEDYVDDGAAVVRLGNIGFSEYRQKDQARIPMSLYRRFRHHNVQPGDVIIAGLGDARNHAGRACVAPDLGPTIVKGKCFRARLEASSADAEFISLLLSSPLGASAIEGRGSTRSMINLEIVKSALLPIPSLAKQRQIAKEHRESWHRTKAAIHACDRQVATLAERRQALITAAVTGQFDVSTASGRNVTDGVHP
ncbi:restriction endonuclease subunit S [Streptomyces sp. NPDC018000]|uniref:restriction endonuclease subunit S n=1 Tax=Streptomyces sp. NPDC018000 TaxID=3365028 RepID=UPI0037BB28E4